MRRLGLIGDVHAEDAHLAAALERLGREGLDGILCTGDLTDGRGDVDRCVELLRLHEVLAVRGNHDRWCIADQMRDWPGATAIDSLSDGTREYLQQLPATRRLDTVAGPLLLAHGLGREDMIRVGDRVGLAFHVDSAGAKLRADPRLGLDADIRIHVGGHTHNRWAEQVGGLTMINAGTLRASDTPCFGVLDLAAGQVQSFDLDENGGVLQSERIAYREDN